MSALIESTPPVITIVQTHLAVFNALVMKDLN